MRNNKKDTGFCLQFLTQSNSHGKLAFTLVLEVFVISQGWVWLIQNCKSLECPACQYLCSKEVTLGRFCTDSGWGPNAEL